MKFEVAEIDKHNLARGCGKKYLLAVDISAIPQTKAAHVRCIMGNVIMEKENGDPTRWVSTGVLINALAVALAFSRLFRDRKPQHFSSKLLGH